MALSIDQVIKLADDGAWQRRVQIAFIRAAIEVRAEADTTPLHDERVGFARTIMGGRGNWTFLAAAVLSQDGLVAKGADEKGADLTDEDLLGAVRAIWNALS